jgi:transcriptional regulator with XRE-family HTH domain
MAKEPKKCLWCKQPIEREPGESIGSYSQRRYHMGECRRLASLKMNGASKTARKLAKHGKRVQNVDLTEYTTVKQLAKDAGVWPQSIQSWLKKSGKHRWPHYFVRLRVAYVSLDLAEAYLKMNRPKPKGWLPIKYVRAELGRSAYHFIRRLRDEGTITIVRNADVDYLSPADADFVIRSFRNDFPLPGWMPLTEVAKRANVTRSSAHHYFKRHPENEQRWY